MYKSPEIIKEDDILWALRYAQPYVDGQHSRPKTVEELDSEPWCKDYIRFWYITEKLGMTEETNP